MKITNGTGSQGGPHALWFARHAHVVKVYEAHAADPTPDGMPSCYSYATDEPCNACGQVLQVVDSEPGLFD
jgi:hypothetical protein